MSLVNQAAGTIIKRFKFLNQLNRVSLGLILLCSIGQQKIYAEESHPGQADEAAYMEAVVAFNKKQLDETISICNKLIKKNADHVQALELMALASKQKGDEKQALETYLRLLKLKPEAEKGPYYFETAVIFNRQKKSSQAKSFFEKSIAAKFNEVAAHLFIGLIDFGESDYGSALKHFKEVEKLGNQEMQVVGSYYQGLVYFKLGNSSEGTSQMLEAKDLAKTVVDSKMAKDIGESASKMLAPFSNRSWFSNITALGQYDSNVTQTALAGTSPLGISGKSTAKVSLMGGAGLMTAPMNTIQWVPSYRFAYNHNFNAQTTLYEFLIHTASMYFNYRPLAQTNGGFKIDGNFMFQHQPVSAGDLTKGYVFRKYSISGEVGPFLKTHIGSLARWELETFFRPNQVFESPDQTGFSGFGRSVLKFEFSNSYFRPNLAVTFEKSQVPSNTYKLNAIGASLSNSMLLPFKIFASESVDYSQTSYPYSKDKRKDQLVTFRLSLMRSITSKWSVLLDNSFSANRSTIPKTYSYNRLMLGLGTSLSF